jgi:predicted metal-dependent phosphoesterase TrpH
MLIDLQMHSNYSDGYFTPTELAKFAFEQGAKIVSLTDHNTVAGQDEFRRACRAYKLKPITGMELYVRYNNKRFNLLWYNFNDQSPDLHDLLRDTHIRRRAKVRQALEKLKAKGFKLETDKILDKYIRYIPINHIISDVMDIKFNAVKIKNELGTNKPREEEIIRAYFHGSRSKILDESYIDIQRVVALKKKIGGQLVLNHPGKHKQLQRDLVLKLKKMGIDGIEILSPHHSYGFIVFSQHIAQEFNLIMTGGSDFHLPEGNHSMIKTSWQYFKIDSKYLKGIERIIG